MPKFCGGCKANKDYKDFYNNKKKADGKQTQCKTCMKDQNKKNYVKHKDVCMEEKNVSLR